MLLWLLVVWVGIRIPVQGFIATGLPRHLNPKP